jgi:hypothetical protein
MNFSECDRESLRYAHDNWKASMDCAAAIFIVDIEERGKNETNSFVLLMVVEKRRELVDCRIPTQESVNTLLLMREDWI